MKSKSPISFIVGFLVVLTGVFGGLFWHEMGILNNAYTDMNQIEFLSSTTQRLISLAHSQHENIIQKDVFFIDDSTQKSLKPSGESSLTVLNNVDIVVLANEVIISWDKINDLLSVSSDDEINTIDLSLARDSHYKAMTNLSDGISEYTVELNKNITAYQGIIMCLVFIIAFIMLNSLLRTHTELKITQNLAEMAQLDTSTGLYNRSRCQELFKSNSSTITKKQPAIIVIDLNDLKKTNDSMGHRVGDELISAFALILKNACNIHSMKPFLGRYGGDEFIVFYENIAGEDEITTFTKELEFLAKEYNDKETRFKVSYAIGYAYADKHNDKLTVRQLFDKADEKMYENKVEMKRLKDPNYDKKIEEGEDVR